VFRHTEGAVDAWLMDGSEIVASGQLASMNTNWQIVGFVDLDGDHTTDLVMRNNRGTVYAGFVDGLNIFSNGLITSLDEDWVFVNPR
jgi:hypothetical protein